MIQKNPRTFFSHKIKSSEKQKCVKTLFLSKYKLRIFLLQIFCDSVIESE